MSDIKFIYFITSLLLTIQFVVSIYDPSVTTTKPQESLAWYLNSENSQSPLDVPLATAELSKKTWRDDSPSEIEQQSKVDDKTFDQGQEVYSPPRDLTLVDGLGPYDASIKHGNGENIIGFHREVGGRKNYVPSAQSLHYEGAIDSNDKPRKEDIIVPTRHSNVAKFDGETGVQCPYPGATGQFIHPVDCRFFVNCWNGRGFVQPCAPGTHFNPETLECDYPYKVKCYENELTGIAPRSPVGITREPFSRRYSSPEPEKYTHQGIAECPVHFTGRLPHSTDCTKFRQCVNGNAIIETCLPGTVFNPKIGACDAPKNVRGCEHVIASVKYPSSGVVHPPHSSSAHSDWNIKNSRNSKSQRQESKPTVCPADFSGLLPHPDCRKFLQCDRGGTFIRDCGPGTVFNPLITVCDWPYNVPGCGQSTGNFEVTEPWNESENREVYEESDGWHGHSQTHQNSNRGYQNMPFNQPQPCVGCRISDEGPQRAGRFYPPESHQHRYHQFHHHDRWSQPDPYAASETTQQTVRPSNSDQKPWPTPTINHLPDYGSRRPLYHSREPYGRSPAEFPLPGGTGSGNVYVESAFQLPREIGNSRVDSRNRDQPVWIPNSGPYGDVPLSTRRPEPQLGPWREEKADEFEQQPVNVPRISEGHEISSEDDKLDSWMIKPNVIEQSDKDIDRNTKQDALGIKTNPLNGVKDHVDTDQSQTNINIPPGIYLNINDTKGGRDTRKQAHNEAFDNEGSKWKPRNHTFPGSSDSNNRFNSNQRRWKLVKSYNGMQDSAYNSFNQSQTSWKPANKTISNPTPSLVYSRASDSTSYYPEDESTTAATINKDKIPSQVIRPWHKSDTSAPSVSIDDDDNIYRDVDEQRNEFNIAEIPVEPTRNKYDIEILDKSHEWKPKLHLEKETKKEDNSVIMKINPTIIDVDIFNAELAPWQEDEPSFSVYYIPPVQSLGHLEDMELITPSSGQVVRLRGGASHLAGYIEIQGIQPGWGVVCDVNNGWTQEEANIVCQQLGYTRGAEAAWQGRPTASNIPVWIAATGVDCQGNETRFQTCKFTHGSNCNVQRDAVGVSCHPNHAAYCRKDEVSHGGNCYHVADANTGLNHAEALTYCSARDSKLVDIATQYENNFLSEWLINNYEDIESIMTSGIGFAVFNQSIWMWEDSTAPKFKFTNWWPGWKDKKSRPSPGSRPVCIVMKKKFPCHNRPDSNCTADYFFWDIEDCATSMKGHSYICKRPYDDISCVYGKGHQYSGNANITASGKQCLPWNHESIAYPLLVNVADREVREKLKTHNFCRNPNPVKESKPWCFTGPYGEFEHCDIPPCGNIGTTRSRARGQCKKGHFQCMPGECIPSHWVCDGEEDCTNGRDENFCLEHLKFFTKTSGNHLVGHDVVKWLNTPLQTCALRCKEADFTCRSFSHKSSENLCLLSDNNVGSSGALKPEANFDYYEMTALSVDCSDLFTCNNRKCINRTSVCDGKNDCNDRSDESSCSAADLDYSIRLADGGSDHEGRVEVKVMGHWGQICDDAFGMMDAQVICKELGFPLGALEVKSGGFYGNLDPSTRFLVDQLKCHGNETSLRECDFDGWGVHDCAPAEAVGIVCKTTDNTCQKGLWKCDTTAGCISPRFICDGFADCRDGSDESPTHCKSEFQIRLANGSRPLEGRVEIFHHGIWGTICDDDFTQGSAQVVCNLLGHTGPAEAKKGGVYGPGDGPIWLDELMCRGNESHIDLCSHDFWGMTNCNHDEDVGVTCSDRSADVEEEVYNHLPEVTFDINQVLPANCGRRAEDFHDEEEIFAKVARGSIAPRDSYPWQASIRVRGHSMSSHHCGAVVISPLHVLTAAHCLQGYPKDNFIVRAGDYNTETDEGTEAEAFIEDYYIHEDFRKGCHMSNDIALVLLRGQGISLGLHIMPICLPSADADYPPGMNCTISGFGSFEVDRKVFSPDLRFGWVPLVDQSICRSSYIYGRNSICDGMVCAGSLDESVDTCDGDSGGPLACLNNGAFTLYGITSWGRSCGKANSPGVYVRIAHYRDWIDKKIQVSLGGR